MMFSFLLSRLAQALPFSACSTAASGGMRLPAVKMCCNGRMKQQTRSASSQLHQGRHSGMFRVRQCMAAAPLLYALWLPGCERADLVTYKTKQLGEYSADTWAQDACKSWAALGWDSRSVSCPNVALDLSFSQGTPEHIRELIVRICQLCAVRSRLHLEAGDGQCHDTRLRAAPRAGYQGRADLHCSRPLRPLLSVVGNAAVSTGGMRPGPVNGSRPGARTDRVHIGHCSVFLR